LARKAETAKWCLLDPIDEQTLMPPDEEEVLAVPARVRLVETSAWVVCP
jgi:hypothetical protein